MFTKFNSGLLFTVAIDKTNSYIITESLDIEMEFQNQNTLRGQLSTWHVRTWIRLASTSTIPLFLPRSIQQRCSNMFASINTVLTASQRILFGFVATCTAPNSLHSTEHSVFEKPVPSMMTHHKPADTDPLFIVVKMVIQSGFLLLIFRSTLYGWMMS